MHLVPGWCRFGSKFYAFFTCRVRLPPELTCNATVGGQQFQRQRIHLLKAAGGLVPQLSVMALQRELTAHSPSNPGNQSQLVGQGGVSQRKSAVVLKPTDIPGLAVQRLSHMEEDWRRGCGRRRGIHGIAAAQAGYPAY